MDTSTQHRASNATKTASTHTGSDFLPEDYTRTRRAVLIACAGAALMLVSMLWPGATLSSTAQNDATVYGGSGADEMWATKAGGSVLDSRAGDDEIYGGKGEDVISAGAGDDFVEVFGGGRDHVTCGPGSDLVNADSEDIVTGDCETVYISPAP